MNLKTSIMIIGFILVMVVGPGGCGIADKPITTNTALDYKKASSWVSQAKSPDKPVDVFYVYPTISRNPSGTMDITNDEERALAQGIFVAQATVFEEHANVFGVADVENAFKYYIENLNDGRPFIIAGHSQGTMALIEVIKTPYFNDENLTNRLVAAYSNRLYNNGC